MGLLDFLVKSDFIVTTKGNKLDKSLYSNCKFDLSQITKDDNRYLLLGNENIKKAIDDILYLNLYLKEAPNKHQCFPFKQISSSKLCFKKRLINGTITYCFLSFAPLTNTGKKAKHPYSLHFYVSAELFGDIYYDDYGEIDKALIIAWNKGVCCELNLAIINDVLDIKAIYKTNPATFKKQKMYYL